jgi:hypothetical protein
MAIPTVDTTILTATRAHRMEAEDTALALLRSSRSAGGVWDPVPGIRYSQRTGSPVSRSNSSSSANLVPIGVENATTRQPAPWSKVTSDGRPSGAGAPLITRYSTLGAFPGTSFRTFQAKFWATPE